MTPGQAWACQDQGGQQRHAVVPGGVTDRLEDGSLPSDRISQGSGAGRRCGLPAQGSTHPCTDSITGMKGRAMEASR